MSRWAISVVAAVAGLATLTLAGGPARASAPLTLQYNERPPFMETKPDGIVSGVSAEPVARAFEKIGVPVSWVRVPVARQLAILRQNDEPVCSVGWYRTSEREKFAKFSNPVSQDTSMIGLADPRLKLPPDIGLDDLLANPEIGVAIKQSVIYGRYLDGKLATMKAKRIEVSAEFGSIIHMIELGRAGLTFVPLEEARYYVRLAGMDMKQFQILHFSDMPPGEKRYLMCSRKVPDELIERVNAYLPGPSGDLGQ